jgi:hypothetical protein
MFIWATEGRDAKARRNRGSILIANDYRARNKALGLSAGKAGRELEGISLGQKAMQRNQ